MSKNELVLLFVEGKGGKLCARGIDGRIYLPNKGSGITKAGLYSCTIFRQMSNCTFVNGTPKEASELPPLPTLIGNMKIRQYFRIGESIIILNFDKNMLEYWDSDFKRITDFRFRDQLYQKYFAGERINVFTDIDKKAMDQAISFLDDHVMKMAMSIIAINRTALGSPSNSIINNVAVFDNKIFAVRYQVRYQFDHCKDHNSYAFFVFLPDSHEIFRLNYTTLEDVCNLPCEKLSIREIQDYMVLHHIGIGYGESLTIEREVNFKNEETTVEIVNGDKLLSVDEETEKRVEESWKEFEEFRKRIKKYATAKNASELKDITNKHILGLPF